MQPVTDPNMSDEAVRKGTGRDWAEWVALLDEWGARERSHTEIARHVAGLGVDGWWAQSVTVGYERITGLRQAGQRRDGGFQGSASKTFPVPVARLFVAMTDAAARDQWLPPGTLMPRTAQPERSARFDSADGIVACWFTEKGPAKSSLQVQVDGLASADAAAGFRERWKARFADLAVYLTAA